MAADTATITVSANVLGTCAFDTSVPYTMAFGAIDPTGTDDVLPTSLNFTCTNGTKWRLNDLSGAQTMTSASSNTLAYTIAQSAVTGIGTGSPEAVVITGTIANGDKSGAAVDTYTDALIFDLIPEP
jgi:spore coat protein U-like protein